jgi:hypothetical protein
MRGEGGMAADCFFTVELENHIGNHTSKCIATSLRKMKKINEE